MKRNFYRKFKIKDINLFVYFLVIKKLSSDHAIKNKMIG